MDTSYGLSLADGTHIRVTAGDAGAAPIVEMLARAMKLTPGGAAEHSLLVLTGKERETFSMTGSAMVFRFPVPKDKDELVSSAMEVSLTIAHATQRRGGVLVHGGLAEYEGNGVILAAPGGTGKSTAASRLPEPWRSRSDDAALVVRNQQGNYFAHPWPTWSLFYENGPRGEWDTAVATPLKALYFLFQSPRDALEELIPTQAAAMLIESVEQANRVFDRRLSHSEIQENHLRQFSIICALTAALTAYRLRLSLTGEFWKLMEGSINPDTSLETVSGCLFQGLTACPDLTGSPPPRAKPVEPPSLAQEWAKKYIVPDQTVVRQGKRSRNDTAVPAEVVNAQVAQAGVVFSGNSMYPTLKEPDYLEICPYQGAKPRRGDVVYFRAPSSGTMVVHRVMKVQPEGVLTRGDNNPCNDPGIVPLSAVEGRVVAVRGSGKNRPVRGGAAGVLDYLYAGAFRKSRIMAGWIYRLFFRPGSFTGGLRSFAPCRAEFKFVLFGKIPLGHMKILVNNQCAGQYVRGAWHISYPWRLLVDPAKIAAAAKRYETAKAQWLEAQMDIWNG